QVPPQYQQLAQEAHRRVECKKRLESALASGNEGEVQRCYVPAMLDDWPAAAQLVGQARQTPQVLQVLETLNSAAHYQRWDVFKQTWLANQGLLENRPSAQPYKRELEKVLTADILRRLLSDHTASDQAILEHWERLKSLGGEALLGEYAPLLQQRVARTQVTDQLQQLIQRVAQGPTVHEDVAFVQAWQTSQADASPQFAQFKPLYFAARTRVDSLNRLKELNPQCTVESESAIESIGAQFPPTYEYDLKWRVQMAADRLKVYNGLTEAMKQPDSDVAVLKAYQRISKMDAKTMLSAEAADRVKLARKRYPLIKKLHELPKNLEPDQLDEVLLEMWDEELLAGCNDVAAHRARFDKANKRKNVVVQVRAAMAADDLEPLEPLVDGSSVADYPLPDDVRRVIVDVQNRIARAAESRRQGLRSSLMESNREEFTALFDAKYLSELCEKSRHHQALASRFTEEEILPLDKSGLARKGEKFLEQVAEKEFAARWEWPREMVSTQCQIAVCKEPPPSQADPNSLDSLYFRLIDRAEWSVQNEEHRFAAEPEWAGATVLVWAIVDLGYFVFHTEPLELGRLAFAEPAEEKEDEQKAAAEPEASPPADADAPADPNQPEEAEGEKKGKRKGWGF
ncbi:MAG: hypothetical protein N2C14_24360, partial [Planctomycetales bacterium]